MKNKETTVAIKGIKGFQKFAPLLIDRSIDVQTPCEGFAVIELGPFDKTENNISTALLILLEVGGEHPQHKHAKSDATFHFVNGEGDVILGEDEKRITYTAGTIIEVPRGVLHGFEARENGVMLATQKGEPVIAKDGTMDIEYLDQRCFTEHGAIG